MLSIRKLATFLTVCGSLSFGFAQEAVVKEIPFEPVYSEDHYTHYVGSQIITGELEYIDDAMYGYYFNFIVDDKSLDKIPELKTTHDRIKSFTLNGLIDMSPDELDEAMKFLEITDDLAETITDPSFAERTCTLKGPATLLVTSIDFAAPPESEYFSDIESIKVMETGPFDIKCEKES